MASYTSYDIIIMYYHCVVLINYVVPMLTTLLQAYRTLEAIFFERNEKRNFCCSSKLKFNSMLSRCIVLLKFDAEKR